MKTSVLLTVLTSASASLCCIVPFLGIVGGSGSLISSVSWLEPFRPVFIGGTVLILGFAWYRSLKASKSDECGCEVRPSFLQSRKFLGIVTALSLLLISFPSYSKFVIQQKQVANSVDQENKQKITLGVNGMTCSSCEHHIESEVIKLPGVSSVKASYATKSATVEYDQKKVDEAKITEAINATGYVVVKPVNSLQEKSKTDCCAKGLGTAETCGSMPKVSVPSEKSKNLKVLASVDQLKDAFNKQNSKIKFVAILSSTCGWCLQGAQAIQETVLKMKKEKNIDVIIVWTNMLKSDDQENASKAASMFRDPSIIQYFDAENKFGDVVARRLNPKGEKAWDIYMFFEGADQWSSTLPRPFDYAHQLSKELHPWSDDTKYFCGDALTKRLNDITNAL